MKRKVPYAVFSTTLALSMLLAGGAAPAHAEAGAVHVHQEVDKNLDTDNDGLKDVFEQGVTHAYKADTDLNGVSDAYEDNDVDGLSNLVEQSLGTNPLMADSDGDTLSDYDEMYAYNTNPALQDTDSDNLSDGVEVKFFHLNPLQADEDGDGQLDGQTARSFALPQNDLGIKGTATGIGDLPFKFTVRNSPILFVQSTTAAVASFDIENLDSSVSFQVSVPVPEGSAKDLALFHYNTKNATYDRVKGQTFDKETNAIEAEFTDGGSFVLMSEKDYKASLRAEKAEYKGKYKAFKGKAKLVGAPGVEIDGAAIDGEGVFTIEKDGKKAQYKVNDMQVSGTDTTLTAMSITTESGLQPTILVHGLLGSSKTWGFNNLWSNGATPKAESAISSTQSFTHTTYASGATSTFSNIDVHYITSVSDTAEMGPILDTNKGYTRNVDLFIYEYDSDGHVATAANGLKGFISGLRSKAIIASTQDVNLMGHSKGGLVSRYYIENLAGSANVTRLVTLGTPHYGSDLSTFGDMDRDDSELWLNNGSDSVCNAFTNSHPYTKYFAFGGFNASAGDLNATSPSQRGVWSVGKLTDSYDADVRTRFANAGNAISWFSYGDIGDTAVNIDSAMGSDKDPDYSGTLPTLTFQKRWYIFHETYGEHSPMRKYSTVQNLATSVLAGSYDL
jgi:pimeloyl-ACP methyl ester carboxylesterase